jgi:outer membrane protein OmpA-like peptidoglycan-associated protein
MGATGAQGRVGVVGAWTSYREFWFDYDSAEMNGANMSTVAEIATYLNRNPSLDIGIDGSMDPRGTDPPDQDLSNRRVRAIHDALVNAGVPGQKIKTGAFGDTQLRRDRRVEVLFASAN